MTIEKIFWNFGIFIDSFGPFFWTRLNKMKPLEMILYAFTWLIISISNTTLRGNWEKISRELLHSTEFPSL